MYIHILVYQNSIGRYPTDIFRSYVHICVVEVRGLGSIFQSFNFTVKYFGSRQIDIFLVGNNSKKIVCVSCDMK